MTNKNNFGSDQNVDKLKDKASDMKDQAYDKAQKMKDEAQDAARHTIDEVKERFSEAQENITTFVQKHPFQAMLYSLLAGVVTAKMLSK